MKKYLLPFFALAVSFVSCNNENQMPTPALEGGNGIFEKSITVVDATGENSVVIKVSAEDQSLVNLYTSANFALVINPVDLEEENIIEEAADDLSDFSAENSLSIAYGVIKENLRSDVVSYEIELTDPKEFADMRASFSDKSFYSGTQNGVYVKRTSINRRCYISFRYCMSGQTCGTSTSDIRDGWEHGDRNDFPLSNNQREQYDNCNNISYIGVVVKSKKHEKSKYTYGFYKVAKCY